jgi:hypothetical protein
MPGQKRETRLRARCPGHPRLNSIAARKGVDGRDKPGHDGKGDASSTAQRALAARPASASTGLARAGVPATKEAHRPSQDDNHGMMGLTPILTNFYRHCRRFLVRGSKGNAVRGGFPNAAAAPATVSGESFVICHWESRSWEGDARYRPASQETCRQPWSHARMSVGEYRH